MIACSALAADEPLAGSASQTRGWVVVEHPGPYGRVAADALGAPGAELHSACREAGFTLILARRPRSSGHAAWLAIAGAMVTWRHLDPRELLGWDWSTVDSPTLPVGSATTTDPLLFVCTNGKRDACCALIGRPVASTLIEQGLPVWECSHLGGHRFAPTALLLPFGSLHGRLDAASARRLIDGAREGVCDVSSLRGLGHLPPDQQVADVAVRRAAQIDSLVRLEVVSTGDDQSRQATVRHPEGRTWSVDLKATAGRPRPESCGKDESTPSWWSAGRVRPL